MPQGLEGNLADNGDRRGVDLLADSRAHERRAEEYVGRAVDHQLGVTVEIVSRKR